MSNDLRQQLARVAVKSQMLTERYRALEQQKEQAYERIAELERELTSRRSEIKALQQQLDYLKLTVKSGTSREEAARSRTILSEILREIDKCIEQLTF